MFLSLHISLSNTGGETGGRENQLFLQLPNGTESRSVAALSLSLSLVTLRDRKVVRSWLRAGGEQVAPRPLPIVRPANWLPVPL